MKKLYKVLIVLLLMAAITDLSAIGQVIVAYFDLDTVQANPNECPPGQEKKGGCKWVQHLITGKCQWLPDHAVANPWIEIAEGTCPVKTRPSATPMNTIVVVTPKITSLVVETSTCTPKPTSTKYITVPSNTPTSPPAIYSTPTLDPKKSEKPAATSTPIPTYYCDQCSVESAHATNDAEMLHAVETLKAYIMRP